jgi:structural maintenance of chromosome 1
MRDQRSGTATFIPLNTIQVRPIDDKFRSFHRARMAIDVISFDASLERAMHYVCGNAIVCDDLETARSICYDRRQEVKGERPTGLLRRRLEAAHSRDHRRDGDP